jgi:hypothetical protein
MTGLRVRGNTDSSPIVHPRHHARPSKPMALPSSVHPPNGRKLIPVLLLAPEHPPAMEIQLLPRERMRCALRFGPSCVVSPFFDRLIINLVGGWYRPNRYQSRRRTCADRHRTSIPADAQPTRLHHSHRNRGTTHCVDARAWPGADGARGTFSISFPAIG